MKKLKTKYFVSIPVIIFFLSAALLYASEGGRTGRTLKSSTQGCGGCHGSSSTADVNVLISGPDTVNTGQTVQYSLTVTKQSKTGAGLDIAVRRGALNPVSTNIHLSNGELTHNNNISMTNGSVTVQFNYIAPATVGIDTIWATGLATNSDGGTSGDDWNWAPSKRVVVRLPTGTSNNSLPVEFALRQNYPNPFNPGTVISYQLAVNSYVTLKIYDLLGREVMLLTNGFQKAGSYQVNLNGNNLSGGMYYYKITAGEFTDTKKMMLVK